MGVVNISADARWGGGGEVNFDFWPKPDEADFIQGKKEVNFKVDLHSRNSVGTMVTSRIRHLPKFVKIYQYLLFSLLFVLFFLAEAKCGGRPIVTQSFLPLC